METSALNIVRHVVSHWWLILIAGILLTVIGSWMMISPIQSLLSLCLALAIGMMASGCFEIIFSIKNYKSIKGWRWLLAAGLIDLLIGGYLYNYPLITMVLLPIAVSMWILFRGIMALANAEQMHDYGLKNWRWLAFMAISVMSLAFIIILYPLYGIKTLMLWTGVAFILSGMFRVYLALKLRTIALAFKNKFTV